MLQPNQLIIDQTAERFVLPFSNSKQQAALSIAPAVQISVTGDLAGVEDEWREFEQRADCTPFQTFDWLATWQRCIGAPAGVTPAIVTARRSTGELLLLLPLAIERKRFG